MKIYNRIQEVLKGKKISKAALARGVNVNKSNVGRWCKNTSQPSLATIFDIADFLEVSAHELIPPKATEKGIEM